MNPSACGPTLTNSIGPRAYTLWRSQRFSPGRRHVSFVAMQAPPQGYAPGAPALGGPIAATPGVSIWICRHCGVVAPIQGRACEVCKQPLETGRAPAPPQPVDHTWVAVRCAFPCNSCRFLAPLDSLDA